MGIKPPPSAKNPKFYFVWQVERQFVYTMFICNNHTSFHLWLKEKLAKHQKVLKYYKNLMSTPFYFFDVSPVEKLLLGLTPHTFLTTVSQAVPTTMVVRQGAFISFF